MTCAAGGCAEASLIDDPAIVAVAADSVVVQVAGATETHVVLVVNPADCLTCYTPVVRWIYWAQTHPRQFTLLFTGSPAAVERRRLIPLRLLSDAPAILSQSTDAPIPLELVFTNHGLLVYADALSPARNSSPLLNKLAENPNIDALFAQQSR